MWPFYFVLFLPYIGEYVIAIIADIIMNKNYKIKGIKRKIKSLSRSPGNEEKITELQLKLDKLCEQIEKSKAKRAEEKKEPYKIKIARNENTKWLILIMLVCILTGLLTPLGDTPYTYLVKTMQGNTTQNINEHQPLTLINNQPALCLIIAYLAILTFTKTKIQLRDLFMVGGLTLLMLYSKRQETMLVLIGSVVLNRLFVEMLKGYVKKDFIDQTVMKNLVTKVGAFVIIVFVLGIGLHFVDKKKNNKIIDETTYPVAACDYILENIDIENMKLYNDYNYGSYLIYRGIPVFIDSRADLYAPEFNTKTGDPKDGKDIFMDFIEVSGIAKYYDSMFDDYDITHVITTSSSKIAMLIDNRNDKKYKRVYNDKNFVIYEIQRGK